MATYQNPLEMFYQWERELPEQVFMHQPVDGKWLTYTWKQAGDEARRMASVLPAMNLPEGSHIALVSKNVPH